MRLDNYLHEKGWAQSRNKAQELIKKQEVLVDDKIISKPSFDVTEAMCVRVVDSKQYVSRAGYKLKSYLQEQDEINIAGMTCLDVGSSTGGFCQVLLEEGAQKVVAVDVGNEQLHESLKTFSNLEVFEKTDIRDFHYQEKFDMITCDVSFIGVGHIIAHLDLLAKQYILILFKPQFEVGNLVKRDKKGVVKDGIAIQRAKEKFLANCLQYWDLVGYQDSKIKGKEGSVETFYCFRKRKN
ncbi:23S rRNA (cytidine-2'-O)-methyltransferase TlyA [Sulfurospirillum sp. 1612]|uniref:23S rRNA (cytidine-2'-O)-methyltransferase TlyA n=1 Tax=Sulfurospirillum sp. 1612 TaxID=3094835 RepID=UPI002F942BAA